MHIALDSAFHRLKLEEDLSFHPRNGFEHTRGSEMWDFYMVTRGHVSGIYTHWEDTSIQVNKFRGSAHKKHCGWSSATSVFDNVRHPSVYDVNFMPPSAPPPSTPPRAFAAKNKMPVVALTPPQPRQPREVLPACTSALSTLTGSRKKVLYVYPQCKNTTIYADQHQVSAAAHQGLADGSFRKVEVTMGVRNTFELAEESAVECYNILDCSGEE
ncbi:hypothetical protein B0H14DRAFT_3459909 [Mycena olivaceomarginata]|nr:hypothetical protein B0H14DRAFT_3459909 [Mycena olivaceomarginata]